MEKENKDYKKESAELAGAMAGLGALGWSAGKHYEKVIKNSGVTDPRAIAEDLKIAKSAKNNSKALLALSALPAGYAGYKHYKDKKKGKK